MKTKKLSIIIPVFNTKPDLLERCLNSINDNIKEFKKDVEINIIDDNSTSSDTLKWLKKNRKNFNIYYQKENYGAAAAREKGINISKSKYIAFVDSDDYILENYFNIIFNLIDSNNDNDYFIIKYTNEKWFSWEVNRIIVKKSFLLKNNISYYTLINNLNFEFEMPQLNLNNYAEDFSYMLKLLIISEKFKIKNVHSNEFYYYCRDYNFNSKRVKNMSLKRYFLLTHILINVLLFEKQYGIKYINEKIRYIFNNKKIFLFNWRYKLNNILNFRIIDIFDNKGIYIPLHGVFSILFFKKILQKIFKLNLIK